MGKTQSERLLMEAHRLVERLQEYILNPRPATHAAPLATLFIADIMEKCTALRSERSAK